MKSEELSDRLQAHLKIGTQTIEIFRPLGESLSIRKSHFKLTTLVVLLLEQDHQYDKFANYFLGLIRIFHEVETS